MIKAQLKLNFILDNAKALKDAVAQVGWFEESKYKDDLRIGDVAFWQEYGTSTIPQRPFMRPAEMENKEKWLKIFQNEIARAISEKSSLKNVLEKLGMVARGDIQKEITRVFTPPLKESTIKARLRRRGQKDITASIVKPLVDTGLMLATVQSKAEEI